MRFHPLPSVSYVKTRLDYQPLTGRFYWKPKIITRAHDVQWNKRFAGKEAGHIDKKGYRNICLDSVEYFAQRLAFLIMTEAEPPEQIDHMDLNRSNNAWTNLRPATNAQNRANSKLAARNTSGVKGVYLDKRCGKWWAEITVDGQSKWLGSFTNIADAEDTVLNARALYHGEFARAF